MGEMDHIQQCALREAFGESSDDGNEGSSSSIEEAELYGWETVAGIDGLWLCRNFLGEKDHNLLLSMIHGEGWFTNSSHNQAMRFGDLPGWATDLTGLIQKAICFCAMENKDQHAEEFGPLSFDLLWREPLFDQLIVNVYQPGEGICAHIDLMRFEDGIAIVSMESECVMHFSRADKGSEDGSVVRVPVLLNPGSLLVLSGEARYLWKHEINRQTGFQVWKEKEIAQKRRTSVTLRKLCVSKEETI